LIQRAEVGLLLLAPLLWIAHLRSSLWVDETITYWVIKDGLVETVRRALWFQGQSPLYFILAWIGMTLGGVNEVALRLPSVAAFAGATLLVHCLGRQLVNASTGRAAAILFAYGWFQGYADNARPYALALCAVTGSTVCLVRWLRSGRWRDAMAYIATATLIMYLQPLYAPVLGVHIIMWIEHHRARRTAVSLGTLAWGMATVVILCVPLFVQAAWVIPIRREVSFAAIPPLRDVLVGAVPSFVIGILLVCLRRRIPWNVPLAGSLALWTAMPPLIMYAAARLTDAGIVIPRYLLWVAPGLTCALGAVLALLSPWRRFTVLLIAVVPALLRPAGPLEDWRHTIADARAFIGSSDTPVLSRSGLPQAGMLERLSDPEHAAFVLAPFSFYPSPGRLSPLPYDLDPAAVAYMERVAVPEILAANQAVLIVHDYHFGGRGRLAFQAWFDARLPGFDSREVSRHNNLAVIVYRRTVEGSPAGSAAAR
jgi:4-amino-4-deoxy-L-arabinose transferase-like glycosyltransferase